MLVKHSSVVGRTTMHVRYKAKYCHPIFNDKRVEQRCKEIFYKVAIKYKFTIIEIGFDKEHVHMVLEIGIYSMPQIDKWLKGTSGHFLLKEFPEMKKRYFWGSGLWNPATYAVSIGDRTIAGMCNYVRNQGKVKNDKNQRTLAVFVHATRL